MNLKQKLEKGVEKLSRLDWYLCLGLLFLLVIVTVLGFGSWKLHLILNSADSLPIEAIVVKGERRFTSNEEIRSAMEGLLRSSFFKVDVNKVQKSLEALPWVYQASVRREWPAKFKVFLKEQEPIAHWNGSEWLNKQGDIFNAPDVKYDKALTLLPYLYGENVAVKEVLTAYRQINQLLQIYGFNINSLSFNSRHAWRLTLSNGIVLNLGREDRMTRVQRFIDLYPKLEQAKMPINIVDLRYDTGLAVSWKNTHEESQLINDKKLG